MGGSARQWDGELPGAPAPGGDLSIRLVMTKFGAPAVSIAYEVRVEAQ